MDNKRKQLRGVVVSDKMQKTAVVAITSIKKHPRYNKRAHVTHRYKAHNDLNAHTGDIVTIVESRPLSAEKRWIISEIVKTSS